MLDFTKLDGLVPAIVTDNVTGRVLMLGFMNEEAWAASLATGDVTFWSRSRAKLWTKGETSGHKLRIREIRTDCDQDAVEFRVDPVGPGVCHEGYWSCFFRRLEDGEWRRAEERVFDPSEVYTQ